jgi:hypothetical protein
MKGIKRIQQQQRRTELNLQTALIPFQSARLASTQGSVRQTAVSMTQAQRVAFDLELAILPASVADLLVDVRRVGFRALFLHGGHDY